MLIDAMLFCNELDLLEIRLHELDPIVDKFVIVESLGRIGSAELKPAFLKENWEFVRSFEKKIHYVLLEDLIPPFDGSRESPWEREWYQRNHLLQAIREICSSEDDIVTLSDCDEIPRMETVRDNLKSELQVLEQDLFYYTVNNRLSYGRAVNIGSLREIERAGGPQAVRGKRGELPAVKNGGWHFSFFGGIEKIKFKLKSYSHALDDLCQQASKFSDEKIRELILTRKDLFLHDFPDQQHWKSDDPRLPKYFLEHPISFRHFTEEGI